MIEIGWQNKYLLWRFVYITLILLCFYRYAEKYDAVYLFEGIMGEEPVRMLVKGQGAFDGQFEEQIVRA